MLLHSSTTTIQKYLAIPEHEIPIAKENARELQHIQQMKNKKAAIMEVRKLYAAGHAIDKIMRSQGITYKKYPVLGDLYTLLREYHKIIFSQKIDGLDEWIAQASSMQIDELDTYIKQD